MAAGLALTAACLWVGSLFVYAGSIKLGTPLESRVRHARGYRLGPAKFAPAVAAILPFAELCCGSLMLVTPYVRIGALVATTMGMTFALAIGSVLVRGIRTECGCAGSASDRVRASSLARATLIVAAAVSVMVAGDPLPVGVGLVVFALALAPAALQLARSHRSVVSTADAPEAHDHDLHGTASAAHS